MTGGAPARDAGTRLRRLLAVLAVLAREGSAEVADLATRFSMDPHELVADLELAACCGLPPYTPDQLMEIVVDDTTVEARLEPALARPRRLTPAEGWATAAAARAIAGVPGADPDGALARAADKLEVALGSRGVVRVDVGDPPLLGAVRRAVEDRRQLAIRYHSGSHDEVTERTVDPVALRLLDGVWYLDAWCHRAGGARRFRVDRILHAEATGRPSEVPSAADGSEAFDGAATAPYVPNSDATVVRLEVDASSAWVLDAVPHLDASPLSGGRWQVDLAVSSPSWLGRLLVRLGPGGRVVAPEELRSVGAEAAQRILDRYRPSAG